jgi:nicotinate-nucleotide pyrophosphorylase (carboxylating)
VELTPEAIEAVVGAALAEDVGAGDLTTDGIVPAGVQCRAALVAEEPGVICGVRAALTVFARLDPAVETEILTAEGVHVGAGTVLARLSGPARAVLTGERIALNLLARLCGIATLTARYVDLVQGTRATILDTRKTTPGLRVLEKYAVHMGGGTNHRAGLYDAILIKENHLRIAGGIEAALAALGDVGRTPVEVEAETIAEVAEALEARVGGRPVDRILLDNMTVEQVAESVELAGGRVSLEASGGMSLATVRSYAETGVDFISVGALTHSARSLHVSLEVT